jgi:hypothetical protein
VLLVIVVAIIVVLALVGLPRQSDDAGVFVRIVTSSLAAAVILATLRIAKVSQRHERAFGSIIISVVLVAIVGSALTSNPAFGDAVAFLWVMLVIAAPVLVLRQVLASDRVTIQTILGSITVYLLIGVSLSLIAIAMEGSVGFFREVPRSTAYVYFSFVTITSLGYGDLTPYTDGARLVSILAAVISQMYLVIVVARLVAIWKPGRDQTVEADE